jgi:hypothetical protein
MAEKRDALRDTMNTERLRSMVPCRRGPATLLQYHHSIILQDSLENIGSL